MEVMFRYKLLPLELLNGKFSIFTA